MRVAEQQRPRRSRWLGWLVATVVVASIVGYVSGSRVRSPQDVLASSKPPDNSVLTATVDRGRISGTESFVGDVRWHSTRKVSVAPTDSVLSAYVTATPLHRGDRVEPGTVLMTVADRPVIVLAGVVPMLRDLHLGDTGEDVVRLQDGLRDAGYYSGTSDGVFGALSLAALDRLFNANGYDLPDREQPQRGARKGGQGGQAETFAAAAEIVFVPSLPATLLQYTAPIGERVRESVAVLGVGGLVVQVDVPTAWQDLLRGDGRSRTTIRVRVAGENHEGVATGIGRPQIVEDQGELMPVTVEVRAGELGSELDGSKAEVVLRERGAPSGLRVPLSALYSAADLGDFVRLLRGGETVRVPVRVVATGDGIAIIDPGAIDELQTGDEVIVGVERAGG